MTSPIINRRIGGSNLPKDWVPNKDVVVIGRGKKVHAHAGNQKLRDLVQVEVEAYANAKNRAAKSTIIIRVFRAVRADSDIGFVKKDPKTQRYFAVEDTAAKITIAQYFRDALADGYKSSKQYKQKLRDALKRSVSDSGAENRPMAQHCSMMKRSASLGDKHQSMGMYGVSRSMFEDDLEEPMYDESPSYYMKMARTQARSRSSVHGILQSATDLLTEESSNCEWTAQADTLVEETNVRIPNKIDESLISKDVFSNLYSAFGSNVDTSCNPFEPTPLKEQPSCYSMKAEPVVSASSPFGFSFENAFGCSKDQDMDMADV